MSKVAAISFHWHSIQEGGLQVMEHNSIISDRDGELDCLTPTGWEKRGNGQVEWNKEICEKIVANI